MVSFNYMSHEKKPHRHTGRTLIAGAIFGLAAGIFMSSREGKRMAGRLQIRAKEIETKLRKEFEKRKTATESAYAESIDSVLAYYLKSKEIAKSEIPQLRTYLLGKWAHVKTEIASVSKSKPAARRKPAKRKRT
jgi:hypothetical protein